MRAALRIALAVPLALSVSCADMPTAPHRLATVTGRILDRDGAAAAQAWVHFFADDSIAGGPRTGYQAQADGQGRYAVSVAPARYHVVVDPPYGSGLGEADAGSVIVPPSGRVLDYRYQGVRISGRVLLPTASTARVVVLASSNTAYAVATSGPTSGAYSLLLSAPGPYTLVTNAYEPNTGIQSLQFDVPAIAADTTLDIDLRGYVVDVTVTRNGTIPVTDARVLVTGYESSASAPTDLNGTARLYLASGWYSFTARTQSSFVELDPVAREILGDGPVALDLQGVVWSVTLRRSDDGTPVPGAYVLLYDVVRQTRVLGTTANAAGAFQCVVYAGRAYDLEAYGVSGDPYRAVPIARGVLSAADSTFDLTVDVPAP